MTPIIETLFDLDPDRLDRRQLPLYNTLLDECARLERRSAERKWLMGTVIRFVRDGEVYQDYDLPSFSAWVRQRHGFDVEQAERYILIADFPRDILRGVEADIHRLVSVRRKEQLFWPPLLMAAHEGVREERLNRAVRSGTLHLLRHRDEQAACEHVLAVALGDEPPLKAEDRQPKPSELGRDVVRTVRGRGVRGKLAQLLKMKAEGRDLQGRWMTDLSTVAEVFHAEVTELCGAALEQPAPEQPAPEQPAPAPAKSGANPRRVSLEKAQEDEDLDMNLRVHSEVPQAVNCPDPCPLCQGGGPVGHRAGCALLLEGRRCCGCGGELDAQGELRHRHLCGVRMMQDDRHQHSWRCRLDPLCVWYQGSPADPGFTLPHEPDGPVERSWLYQPVAPASGEAAAAGS